MNAPSAEVLVDHHDLLRRPPQGVRAPLEVILPRRTLAVVVHLLERRLPHVQVRESTQMVGRHRARGRHYDDPSLG